MKHSFGEKHRLHRTALPLLCWIALSLLSSEARAGQPWESDPIGIQAYNAYQGIDAEYDLDQYYGVTNENGRMGWGESYVMMGFVSMYEATKETAYLDRLVYHFDAVLANRDDQRGITDQIRNRIMPAWSSTKYTAGVQHAWLVHAGMITDPAARFVYLVNSTPELQSTYAAKASEYETAVRETIDAFDGEWQPLGNEGYYKNPSEGMAVAPYNMQNAPGRTMLNLWLATGETKYRDKVERLANFMKNDLQLVGDRYQWKYRSGQTKWEDLSHGGIDVDFAFECYQAGIVFDETDMQAFVETLKYIYQENEDLFTYYVDGSGGTDHELSNRIGYWGHLGFFDEDVRQLLADWYGQYVYNDPDSRWASADVQCALAAAYLVQTSPVPEPGAFVLLASAGIAALFARNRKVIRLVSRSTLKD
ncbi:MAG: hypothetical protein JW959_00185 [Pirellulales bacterium]|nr:hypothetical protein [Pirellulales bacterium]